MHFPKFVEYVFQRKFHQNVVHPNMVLFFCASNNIFIEEVSLETVLLNINEKRLLDSGSKTFEKWVVKKHYRKMLEDFSKNKAESQESSVVYFKRYCAKNSIYVTQDDIDNAVLNMENGVDVLNITKKIKLEMWNSENHYLELVRHLSENRIEHIDDQHKKVLEMCSRKNVFITVEDLHAILRNLAFGLWKNMNR